MPLSVLMPDERVLSDTGRVTARTRLVVYAWLAGGVALVTFLLAPKDSGCPSEIGYDCPWQTGYQPVLYPLAGLAVVALVALLVELVARRK